MQRDEYKKNISIPRQNTFSYLREPVIINKFAHDICGQKDHIPVLSSEKRFLLKITVECRMVALLTTLWFNVFRENLDNLESEIQYRNLILLKELVESRNQMR